MPKQKQKETSKKIKNKIKKPQKEVIEKKIQKKPVKKIKEKFWSRKIDFFSTKIGKIFSGVFILVFLLTFGVLWFNYQIQIAREDCFAQSQNQKNQKKKVNGEPYDIEKNPNIDIYTQLDKINLEKVKFEKKIPILMYHYIAPDKPEDSRLRRALTVTPENFEAQMKWLYDNSYKSLTLSQYFYKIEKNETIDEKTVLITVDDGYRDFFENAAPILNKYNQTATVFIITDSVGYPAYMEWDQIRTLASQGIEFGSHTLTHPSLKTLGPDKLKKELVDSKARLEKELDTKINFFCYPGGGFNAVVEKATKDAGYKGAVTTMSGYAVSNKELYEMTRFRVSHDLGIEYFASIIENANK